MRIFSSIFSLPSLSLTTMTSIESFHSTEEMVIIGIDDDDVDDDVCVSER